MHDRGDFVRLADACHRRHVTPYREPVRVFNAAARHVGLDVAGADRVDPDALRPDLVLFTGDLVNIRAAELDERMVRLLRRIEAPVYSVTGNHDAGVYIKDSIAHPAQASLAEVVARQREMGWRVLEDTTVYLRRGGDSISLTGLSFDPALRHLRH